MYAIKLFTFFSICQALLPDRSLCDDPDDQIADYLFAGSDKITILTDVPAVTTHESNQFGIPKPGLFSKISGWFVGLSAKNTERIYPEVILNEGTYSCSRGICSRVPGDKNINYKEIKEIASKSTQPGENDLTKNKASHTAFVDPPEILHNINPKDMIDTLEEGYKKKQKNE